MGTGIYGLLGTEIQQVNIDYWCGLCRYPTEGKRCVEKASIQACFRLPNAHIWHLQHECPMAHGGKSCHCNKVAELKKAGSP